MAVIRTVLLPVDLEGKSLNLYLSLAVEQSFVKVWTSSFWTSSSWTSSRQVSWTFCIPHNVLFDKQLQLQLRSAPRPAATPGFS